MDSSKTPQEEMLEARRQINPTELYSILVDNEYININLYPYPKEEVYSSLKGILGSLRLQIGYNESYSWIFDLVIKTNNRFFGEYFILLKYHQNKIYISTMVIYNLWMSFAIYYDTIIQIIIKSFFVPTFCFF